MKKNVTRKVALKELEDGFENAEKILNNTSSSTELFKKIEIVLSKYPKVAEKVSDIPVLVQMVKSYIKGEYRDIPIRSIISIVSALAYFVSPIDLIPDFIPVLGLLDDLKILLICAELVHQDILAYKTWKERELALAI